MTSLEIQPVTRPLTGEITVPGDKSISHRAAILGALAEGDLNIVGLLQSETTRATFDCLKGFGVELDVSDPGSVIVHGKGMHSLREPSRVLFCAGSGTTMRLMSGVCAGNSFLSVLDGTEALKRRPMGRVVEPLRRMGATVLGRENGRLAPLAIRGKPLAGLEHLLPVASAQVKSALLLAGLYAQAPTRVREPGPSRDHTERMMSAFGVEIEEWKPEHLVQVAPAERLKSPGSITVPADLSSAAFLIVAALLVPGSELCLTRVGVNPTRVGLLDVLDRMGARIKIEGLRVESGEPVAEILVQGGQSLHGTTIGGALVPRLIDEFPILAVAATQAQGETRVHEAEELRVKESDRIATLVEELRKMGAQIEPSADGFTIEGPTVLQGAHVSSHQDHRLAMSLAVAGLVARGPTVIEGWECVADSFPGFETVLSGLCGGGRLS